MPFFQIPSSSLELLCFVFGVPLFPYKEIPHFLSLSLFLSEAALLTSLAVNAAKSPVLPPRYCVATIITPAPHISKIWSLSSLFCTSSPNFSNCSIPRELTSVYTNYIRSQFSKALLNKTTGYLLEFCRASCPEVTFLFLFSFHLQRISCIHRQCLLFHCHQPKQSRLIPCWSISLVQAWIFLHQQSFLVSTFFSFHPEVFIYNSFHMFTQSVQW